MSSEALRQWVEASPNIRFDKRLSCELRIAVSREIKRIEFVHGSPLLKVEVIPWDPTWDENFCSIIIRWISKRGIFGRLYSSCVGWKYPQEISHLSDVQEATKIMFDFMQEGVTKQV